MNKKKIIIPVVLISAALTAGLAFFYIYYVRGLSYEGTFVAGITSKIEIERSNSGVPLIRVKTQEDAYFALGFLHAQDRLTLMEFYRAVANGTVSSLVGDKGKSMDRLSWAMGFSRKAKEIGDALRDPYRKYLQAYAKGINTARGMSIRNTLTERDWHESDVISILLMKEWANAFLNNKEFIFPLPRTLKSRAAEEFFPNGLVSYYDDKDKDSVTIIHRIGDLVNTYMGSFRRGMAFYLPAKNSRSDEYLLACTFDSELSLYPGWYPVHIAIEDSVIKGITHTGMPFIFAGNNKDISFCGLSLNLDTQDFCIEQVRKLKDVVQYLSRNGWRAYEAITIQDPNSGDKNRKAVVWTTENGPVLNDIFDDVAYQSEAVTLKSILPGADYLKSLFIIPFAKTIDEASNAVQGINSLPAVYLFASNDYVIQIYSGKVPLRNVGEEVFQSGVTFGWNGSFDLSGTGNKTFFSSIIHSTDSGGPPQQVRGFAVGDDSRALRLQSLIEGKSSASIRDVEEFLYDLKSAHAEKFIPIFIEILKNNPVTSSKLARVYFNEWNYEMRSEDVAPTLFEVFLQRYIHETCADEFPDQIDRIMNNYQYLVPRFYDLVKKGTSPVFDDVKSLDKEEDSEAIFDRAFFKALRILGRKGGPLMDGWKWGTLHQGHYTIPFRQTTFMDRLMPKITNVPIDGGNSTVFYGSVGSDLRPKYLTSLNGMFNNSISRVNMNFSYSTNPLSRFYYGRMKDILTFDLTYVNKDFITTIYPLSSK